MVKVKNESMRQQLKHTAKKKKKIKFDRILQFQYNFQLLTKYDMMKY